MGALGFATIRPQKKIMKDPNVYPGAGGGSVGSTASSLLERAVGKIPGAWDRLVSLYGPTVYGWARRAGLQAEDAADVVQEVFRTLVTHLSRFRYEKKTDTIRGWLWTITRNKVRDHLRRRTGRPHAAGGSDAYQRLLQVADGATDESAEVSLAQSAPLLTRAVEFIRQDFEERTWRAFWGVVVEGKHSADVAADLGISVNAVYIARSRVLRRLRDLLSEDA
jgi:RNA polymerase sigma-70 factor (ECF subfamily)